MLKKVKQVGCHLVADAGGKMKYFSNAYFAKKKQNKGSITVEMTLLSLFVFSIVYLYVMYLLFSISLASNLYEQTMKLYDDANETFSIEAVSNITILEFNIFRNSDYNIKLHLKRTKEDPVKSIRRWQIAIDTVS